MWVPGTLLGISPTGMARLFNLPASDTTLCMVIWFQELDFGTQGYSYMTLFLVRDQVKHVKLHNRDINTFTVL